MNKENTKKQKNKKLIFDKNTLKNAINFKALKEALKDPEVITIINKIKL